jgi:cytoskeletal protein RodZ
MTQSLFFQLIFYEFLGFAGIWGLELKRFWEFWMANLFGTHQEASSSSSLLHSTETWQQLERTQTTGTQGRCRRAQPRSTTTDFLLGLDLR